MRAIALLLLTSILGAAAASAVTRSPAPVPKPRPSPSLNPAPGRPTTVPEIRTVLADIDEGARTSQLSHRQARELRREAGEISLLQERYAVGGLSDAEAAELQNRIEVLRAITNAKRSHVLK